MAKKYCTVKCNNSELSVKPFHFVLGRNKPGKVDDEAVWKSTTADLEIRWDKGGGGPWAWATDTVPRGAAGKNFSVPTQARGTYSYTLVVKVPGKPAITIDPETEIDDGGPPDGGVAKKAAKKATKKAAKKRAKRK